MNVYAVKAVCEDGEILLQMYVQQHHAERHKETIINSIQPDVRRKCGVLDVKVYMLRIAEEYDGPA